MDHLLTVTFATPDAARATLDRLAGDARAAPLEAVCVVSRNLRGRIDVVGGRPDQDDDSFWRRLVESLPFEDAPREADTDVGLPANFVTSFARALQPGRSAIMALTNGVDLDPLLAAMGRHERLIQCDLGDGGGEALRQRIAPDAGERPIWPQSGFGSFQ